MQDDVQMADLGIFDRAADWLQDDNVNGECFMTREVGEVESIEAHSVIYIPSEMATAEQPGEVIQKFLTINYVYAKAANPNIPDAQVCKIAYLRFLCVKNGLVSPRFNTANYHVKYNECVFYNNELQQENLVHGLGVINQNLNQQILTYLRRNFSNIVCCVAYMFRVRGHHYVEDMETRYNDLWNHCLKKNEELGVKWEYIAHNAVHAIFPIVLDNFWKECVQTNKIAGTLIKRFDSAPAGIASVHALFTGAMDLALVLPSLKTRFADLYQELAQLIDYLKANRWAGSVNRNMYGANQVDFNEAMFAPLASIIIAALAQFNQNSPLNKSAALNRIAAAAPISGFIIGRTIQATAMDAANAKGLLEE
ncbi:hypothetical protein BX666DRAFT_1882777 [Dichotomocladium elegans]|nr:hypothetical protein BX666DRAFT_1882777 [Dichotomocladium elegans]